MNSPARTLISRFHDAWNSPARAGHVALVEDAGSSLTYAELAARVGAIAAGLRAAGIREGERVAIGMHRSVDLCLALLGLLVAGACPCVLEPKLGSDEMQRRVALAGMNRVILDDGQANDPVFAGLEGVQRLSCSALVGPGDAWALATPPEAAGLLLFTSGTSGKPKGVLQSHRGLLVNTLGVIAHTGLTEADRLLHVMPLYHTNGVNNQLFAALLAGATVVIASRFKAEDMPALMARHRPTIVTGVPTMYSRMLAVRFPPEVLASLRMARCGSAPITEELHRRVEAHLGRPLVVSYGLSEATCTSTMNPPSRRRIGSVGTVLAEQDVFLSGPAGERISGANREGEICIAGPSLMIGYITDGAAGQPTPIGDALHSGDLGRFDEDGYLFITGRIKDVIIRGGENLSPNLIESVLSQVAGVHACCVVGKPDADLGEVPVAFVVRAAGSRVNADTLGNAVQSALSRIHKPVEYHFVDALPENSVGKVDRKKLAGSLG